MAIDKSIYVPIFTETSASVDSPFFTVFPGQVAMLQAFGFMDHKERVDQATRQVPQEACLEMLLFKETFKPTPQLGACPVMDLRSYQSQLLAREVMRHNDCAFSLSKCNNIMLLNIPGSYCFVMNDASALGSVHIYLRMFTREEFPWNSKFLIGE